MRSSVDSRVRLGWLLAVLGIVSVGFLGALPAAAQDSQDQGGIVGVESKLMEWSTKDARAQLDKIYKDSDVRHVLAMAELLAQEGKLDESKNRLQRAVELAPGDPKPLVLLAETFARQGNREQADATYKRAAEAARKRVAADGSSAEAHLWLGAALVGQRQGDAAAEHLQHALDRAPGNVTALYYMGIARSLQQRWQDAIDVLTRAIQKAPKYAYAYYYRGLGNSKTDRKGDMLSDLENFVFLAPNVPEVANARKLIQAAKR